MVSRLKTAFTKVLRGAGVVWGCSAGVGGMAGLYHGVGEGIRDCREYHASNTLRRYNVAMYPFLFLRDTIFCYFAGSFWGMITPIFLIIYGIDRWIYPLNIFPLENGPLLGGLRKISPRIKDD
jgi:hypothetical protein